MNTLTTTGTMLSHSLVWALIHSLWQGLAIFLALAVALKAIPASNSRIRHNMSFAAFSTLFIWFASTWINQYDRLKNVTAFATPTIAVNPDATSQNNYSIAASGNSGMAHWLTGAVPHLENYIPFIIAAYIAGLILMLLRFAANIIQVRNLKSNGLTVPDEQWMALLRHWQHRLGISRPVQLFLSARVAVPTMIGSLKPVILLPVAVINNLTTDQVETIILHELAHIKRNDYILNIIQAVGETLLFFNPFVWLLSRTIRTEREHCCDDIVVDCASSPLPYAHALALLETHRSINSNLSLAATGNKNQLLNRIKRIMEMKKKNINFSQLTIILATIIVITFTAALFTFTPSFAQKSKRDAADTTKKPIYRYKTVIIDNSGKRTEELKETDKPMEGDGNDKEQTNEKDKIEFHFSFDDDSSDGKTQHKMMSRSASSSSDRDTVNWDVVKKVLDEVKIELADPKLNNDLNNVKKELDSVNWEQIMAEVKKALDDVNGKLNDTKLHTEINIEVKRELQKHKAELQAAKKGMEKDMAETNEVVVKASVSATKGSATAKAAKIESDNIEKMLKEMERDGLINRAEKFSIEKEDNELTINGKKQQEAVSQKYSEYLKVKKAHLKGGKGSLTVNIDN